MMSMPSIYNFNSVSYVNYDKIGFTGVSFLIIAFKLVIDVEYLQDFF